MLYPFFYDTKYLLVAIKEHCANATKEFIRTGNEDDIPENTKQMVIEMTSYFKKYHKFLDAVCDNPDVLL